MSVNEFSELVKSNESYEKIPDDVLGRLKVGSQFFGKLKWLKPGQARYSFNLAIEKAIEYADAKDPFSGGKNKKKLMYDDGKSLLPESDPIHVALTDYGLVTVDGHHHAMASFALGATTAPFLVTHDLRGKNFKDMKEDLWQLGLIYPLDLDGKVRQPQHFYTLQDDTNRFLLSLITVRVEIDRNGKVVQVGKKGGKYPIVIKIKPDASLPFQELRAADVLRQAGFVYDAKAYGDDPPKEIKNLARKILTEAQDSGDSDMKDILLIKKREAKDEINFQTLIDKWMRTPHTLKNPTLAALIKDRCEINLKGKTKPAP